MKEAIEEKKMGLVPDLRRKNAAAALARNGTEIIPTVLPEMQARKHYQRQAFYH